ncbi:tetratricopeptide repeat protein [Sporolactobacillus vineae]|uniref:tetratricopeptide repeat protein n=1 Tax=Sporolactobacillus vineae TaxID=444463 RepID=UPI000287A587|nr:tetratricopeptide repeat protein [Sporolactobacillus vineae]
MNDLETANALLENGQTEDGLAMLKELVGHADDDLLYGAASLYQEYGFLDEAQRVYESLLRRYPGDSGLLLQISDLLIDNKQENRAIDYLSRIPYLDENYLSAQVMLADLYRLEGLDEVAENKLLGALKAAPGEPVVQLALGEFYLDTGEEIKAVKFLRKVVDNNQLEGQNVALKLAKALSLSGEFEQSLKYYRKGLKKEKTLDGLFDYAVTASRIDQNKTVIKALNELKDMDPGYSTLYPVLAHAYEHEGDPKQALETVEEGLKQDDFNARMFEEAGDLAVKLHHPDKAYGYYQKWHALEPENVEALTRMVELKAQDEDYDTILELTGSQEMTDPMLIWFKATALNRTDRLKEAEKYYRSCAPAFANNAEFLQEFGEYLRDTGKSAEGLANLEKAARLHPEDQDLTAFVERLKQDDSM